MNPRRRRRRRSKRRMTAKQARYFGGARRRRRRSTSFLGNPRRKHRSSRRRSHSRRRSRSFRHNPPAVRTIASDLGWAAAGFMSTKIVGNMTAPMLAGMGGDQPVIRVGLKLGIAYLSAWALSSFMGSRVFMPAMLGGSIEAIQDAVKTFIAPTFPMLAANYEPLELYYEPRGMLPGPGMAEYMGDGLSPDHDVIV